MSEPVSLDGFHRLSIALTGESGLSRELAGEYLARLEAAPTMASLPSLLELFLKIEQDGGDVEGAIRQQIMMHPDLGSLARTIIILWYSAELHTSEGVIGGTPEQYFQGLLWPAVRAHAPGLSGGYFGHWTYPPDN